MAQIDASIPLGVRPPQIESPMNMLARAMQIKGLQQETDLNQLKADEYRQGLERTNRMRNILAGGGGSEELRRGGFLKESMELDKNAADVTHRKSETTKNSAETALKKISLYRDAVNGVNDPASAVAYIQAMHADPDLQGSAVTAVPIERLIAQVPQDPAQFAEFKRRFTLGAEKFMVDERQRLQLEETKRHNVTTEGETGRHNRVSEGISAGQLRVAQGNLGLRGQELDFNRSQPRGVVVQSESGPLLVDPRTGTGRAVTGADGQPVGKKDKPLSNAALKQIQEVRDNAVTLDSLLRGFKEDFASKGVLGFGADTQLTASAVLGKDKEAVEWWKNYRKQAELVERHAMFGAALTPTEQASWRNADVGPGMDKDVVKQNLQTRAALTRKMLETTRQDLIDAGQSEQRVNAIAGRGPQATPAPATPNSSLPPGWSVKVK